MQYLIAVFTVRSLEGQRAVSDCFVVLSHSVPNEGRSCKVTVRDRKCVAYTKLTRSTGTVHTSAKDQ